MDEIQSVDVAAPTEKWIEVANGYYEVSDLGSVRRAKPGISTFIGRPVQPSISAGGYFQVALNDGEKIKRHYVHRLVAAAFLGNGEVPAGMVVNHKNNDKQDNRLENLEIITQKQNNVHARATKTFRHGPTKPKPPKKGKQVGERHWMRRHPEKILRGEALKSKLTEQQVREMIQKRRDGSTIDELSNEYKISVAQACRIVKGQRWRHVYDSIDA